MNEVGPLAGTDIPSAPTETVGQYLDRQIQNLRLQLEAKCILKARAEACQMLDYPQDFINQLYGW